MKHVLTSAASPMQSDPPLLGEGFVQFLDLILVPLLQVVLHRLHWDHSLQPPSTEKIHALYPK